MKKQIITALLLIFGVQIFAVPAEEVDYINQHLPETSYIRQQYNWIKNNEYEGYFPKAANACEKINAAFKTIQDIAVLAQLHLKHENAPRAVREQTAHDIEKIAQNARFVVESFKKEYLDESEEEIKQKMQRRLSAEAIHLDIAIRTIWKKITGTELVTSKTVAQSINQFS